MENSQTKILCVAAILFTSTVSIAQAPDITVPAPTIRPDITVAPPPPPSPPPSPPPKTPSPPPRSSADTSPSDLLIDTSPKTLVDILLEDTNSRLERIKIVWVRLTQFDSGISTRIKFTDSLPAESYGYVIVHSNEFEVANSVCDKLVSKLKLRNGCAAAYHRGGKWDKTYTQGWIDD